jgi:hypothetical protein
MPAATGEAGPAQRTANLRSAKFQQRNYASAPLARSCPIPAIVTILLWPAREGQSAPTNQAGNGLIDRFVADTRR